MKIFKKDKNRSLQVARDVVKLAGCNLGDLTSPKFIESLRAFAAKQDLQKLAEKLKVFFSKNLQILKSNLDWDANVGVDLGCSAAGGRL